MRRPLGRPLRRQHPLRFYESPGWRTYGPDQIARLPVSNEMFAFIHAALTAAEAP